MHVFVDTQIDGRSHSRVLGRKSEPFALGSLRQQIIYGKCVVLPNFIEGPQGGAEGTPTSDRPKGHSYFIAPSDSCF